jgi:hypothetical protein
MSFRSCTRHNSKYSFCNVNTPHTSVEFPQKIIPYLITEVKYVKHTIHRTSVCRIQYDLWLQNMQYSLLVQTWMQKTTRYSIWGECDLCVLPTLEDYQFPHPEILYLFVFSVKWFTYSIASGAHVKCIGMNLTVFVFSTFKSDWMAWNHLSKVGPDLISV